MPITEENVRDWFRYHAADEQQRANFESVREAFTHAAIVALECSPTCADQQAGLRLLKQAQMTINSAIATRGIV